MRSEILRREAVQHSIAERIAQVSITLKPQIPEQSRTPLQNVTTHLAQRLLFESREFLVTCVEGQNITIPTLGMTVYFGKKRANFLDTQNIYTYPRPSADGVMLVFRLSTAINHADARNQFEENFWRMVDLHLPEGYDCVWLETGKGPVFPLYYYILEIKEKHTK